MPDEQQDLASRFVDSLDRLVKNDDRAALAALRRGLGKQPGEAAEMFPYVIPFCAESGAQRQDNFFLVAALFASHQGDVRTSNRHRDNLGASYRALAEKTGSDSMQRRFVALLNATREDLDDHLRHAIGLMKANEVPIDFAQLLRDLDGWSSESRHVQRRWAQAFWGSKSSVSEEAPETATASVE